MLKFPGDPVVGFVAYLNHTDLGAVILEVIKRAEGVFVKLLLLLAYGKTAPFLGSLLLAGIRPKIGIVEVNQKLHAVFRCAFSDFGGGFEVVVSSAVAVAAAVKRVVPYANANVVYSAVTQNLEDILRFAAAVLKGDSCLFERYHRRNVHSPNEARVIKIYFFNLDAVLNGDFAFRLYQGRGEYKQRR